MMVISGRSQIQNGRRETSADAPNLIRKQQVVRSNPTVGSIIRYKIGPTWGRFALPQVACKPFEFGAPSERTPNPFGAVRSRRDGRRR